MPAEANEEEEEIDVKKLKANFEETQQIMDVVTEFEEDYSKFKATMNGHDKDAITADVTAKTMKQCYKTLKEHLYQDYPNFDKEKMEQEIHQVSLDIKNSNKELSVLKGEFISVNEILVNKDTNTLKVDQVKRAR